MGGDVDGAGHVSRPQLAGAAVLVLAAGVAVALAGSMIIVSLRPSPADDELVGVISTIAGAAVGAVGAWLGGRRGGDE